MARLTWQDVATPNYGPAFEGYKMFSNMLNNAFESARGAVNTVEGSFRNRENKDFISEVLSARDQDAARAILDGLPQRDMRRITADNLQFAANRPNDLIREQANELGLESSRYSFDRTKDADTRLENAGDALREYYTGAANQSPEAIANFLASEGARGLRPDQLSSVLKSGMGIEESRMGLDFTRERQGWSREDRENDALTADLVNSAAPLIAQAAEAARLGGGNPMDYIADSDAPDDVKNTAITILSGGKPTARGGGGNFSPSRASGGGYYSGSRGGSFSFDNDRSSVGSTLSTKLPPVVVAGFLGNFEVEGGYGGARGDGGTADGIAQWRGSRRDAFKRQYGKDPSKATKQEQAQFVLWELTTPEGRKVAGITDQQARAIMSAKSPGEAATLIDRYYERSAGKHTDRRVAAANAAYSAMGNGPTSTNTRQPSRQYAPRDVPSADPVADRDIVSRYMDQAIAHRDGGQSEIMEYSQKYGSQTAAQVASQIFKNGVFKDGSSVGDEKQLTYIIDKYARKHGLKPSVVAGALERSVQPGGFLSGGNKVFDEQVLDSTLERYKRGGAANEAVGTEQYARLKKNYNQLADTIIANRQRRAEMAASGNPLIQSALDKLDTQIQRDEERLAFAREKAGEAFRLAMGLKMPEKPKPKPKTAPKKTPPKKATSRNYWEGGMIFSP